MALSKASKAAKKAWKKRKQDAQYKAASNELLERTRETLIVRLERKSKHKETVDFLKSDIGTTIITGMLAEAISPVLYQLQLNKLANLLEERCK